MVLGFSYILPSAHGPADHTAIDWISCAWRGIYTSRSAERWFVRHHHRCRSTLSIVIDPRKEIHKPNDIIPTCLTDTNTRTAVPTTRSVHPHPSRASANPDPLSSFSFSQGNHYCARDYGDSAPNQNSYHYSNSDGSYYYSNADGSTYHNDGQGNANYTAPGK